MRLQEREGLTWKSFLDDRGIIEFQWGVRATPTVYLLDPQGVIRYTSLGAPSPEILERRIAKLLETAPR